MAADLTDGQVVETLLGQTLTVTVSDGKVMFDGATVTAADLSAGNGVVHVIDSVLLPMAGDSVTGVDTLSGSSSSAHRPVAMLSGLALTALAVLMW